MNVRRARYHLAKVFDSWYDSIDSEEVRNAVAKDTVITGGSIASLLLGENVKDYDIYFTNFGTVKKVAKYYISKFNKNMKANNKQTSPAKLIVKDGRVRIRIKSSGVVGISSDTDDYQYFESTDDESADEYINESVQELLTEADELDSNLLQSYHGVVKPYQPIFMSDNAITLSGKVQIVVRFYGTPEEIHSNFDYVHCTNYWLSEDRKLYTNLDAVQSILTKDLRYIGSKFPVSSIVRLRRLLRKGWFANAGQILKICMQISDLNLCDITVLEEQLTGIDTAYFAEMIRILKSESKHDKDIDSTYVASIIDKLF